MYAEGRIDSKHMLRKPLVRSASIAIRRETIMHDPVRRLLMAVLILLAALSPAPAVAQTPEAPISEPPYVVEEIAATKLGRVPIATPVAGEPGGLVHAVMGLTINPGASTPPLDVTLMYSVVLHVQE